MYSAQKKMCQMYRLITESLQTVSLSYCLNWNRPNNFCQKARSTLRTVRYSVCMSVQLLASHIKKLVWNSKAVLHRMTQGKDIAGLYIKNSNPLLQISTICTASQVAILACLNIIFSSVCGSGLNFSITKRQIDRNRQAKEIVKFQLMYRTQR